MTEVRCWCGNQDLIDFSPDYKLCLHCGTLVCPQLIQDLKSLDKEGNYHFYGEEYWFEHQPEDYGYPDLISRSRQDLSERALYWLKFVLKYCLPPAKTLELGSAHGGFVALLRLAGFDAAGLEVDPWVVDYSQANFNIPVYTGPIQDQNIKPDSLDLILLFDVLEHFSDPVSTIVHCLKLLKPDGKFLIQTPDYQTDYDYQDLRKEHHKFLEQLKAKEHVYLFSKDSVRGFFSTLGVDNIKFLTPCFSYDMFFVAGRNEIDEYSDEKIDKELNSSPEGRFVQAILDLEHKRGQWEKRLVESDRDRAERLETIGILEQRLIEVDKDRTARLASIHKLESQLKEVDKDRSARLEIINRLGQQLEESEKDRNARLEAINDLNKKIDQIDKDRLKLEELLKESEADRKARLISINKLEELLAESEADRNARVDSVHELERLLEESEADRKSRLNIINELEARLVEAESSRVNMMKSIKNLESAAKKRDEVNKELNSAIRKMEKNLRDLVEEKERNEEIIQGLEIKVGNYDRDLKELREFSARQTQNVHRQAYFIALYEYELNRFPANFLRRVQNKLVREKNRIINALDSSRVRIKDKSLNCIMVDLTPILPGGENGGAKPMTTALIWHFSRTVAPQCEYVLLTSDDAHEELSWLDAPNVRRLCVNQRAKLPRADKDETDNTDPRQNGDSIEVGFNESVVEHEEVRVSQRKSITIKLGIIRSNLFHKVGVVLEKILPPKLYSRIYRFYKRDLFQSEIKKEVLDFDADLLFCPFTAPFYHNANVPTVIVVYDLLFKMYPQFFSSEQIYHSANYLRESCQVASRLICISEYTRGMLLDECNISSEKVITIPISLCNPIEKVDEKAADMVLDKLGLEKRGYFIYPANFWPHKNHEMMLSVFNTYVNRNPDSAKKLVFTGAPGERMEYLKDVVERMDLSENITFAGFLDVRSFSAVLYNSFAMVFPSLFEGFGIPILEAMSFDVPVLSSNRTSLSEVGGNAVHYFDPRKPNEILDALEIVEKDEDYRLELINNGRRRVADFPDPVEWAHNYFNIFRDVVSEDTDFKLSINGIYPDHWAGESFTVHVPEGEALRFLEICIELPDWFPMEILLGSVRANKQKQKKIRLNIGERKVFRYPIFNQGYRIQVKFNHTVQPAIISLNDDKRYLSCRLIWCRLLTPGAAISIYESGFS